MNDNLTSNQNLPRLLRDAERRVNAHVIKAGGDDSLASIPANTDRDVDLLLMRAADEIERLQQRVAELENGPTVAQVSKFDQLKDQCQCIWRSNVTLICRLQKGHEGDHREGRFTWNGPMDVRATEPPEDRHAYATKDDLFNAGATHAAYRVHYGRALREIADFGKANSGCGFSCAKKAEEALQWIHEPAETKSLAPQPSSNILPEESSRKHCEHLELTKCDNDGDGTFYWICTEPNCDFSTPEFSADNGSWSGLTQIAPETEERPELCGHDDGSHCDESCAEKVRKYKEWMAANARTNGYDPNEIF